MKLRLYSGAGRSQQANETAAFLLQRHGDPYTRHLQETAGELTLLHYLTVPNRFGVSRLDLDMRIPSFALGVVLCGVLVAAAQVLT
jgi:hypothetical protein